MKEWGVEMGSRGASRVDGRGKKKNLGGRPRVMGAPELKRIKALRRKGLSIRQISRKVGISRSLVHLVVMD